MRYLVKAVTIAAAAILLCIGKVDAAPRMDSPTDEEPAPGQFAPLQLQEDKAELERLSRELEDSEREIAKFIIRLQHSRNEILKSQEVARRLVEKYVEEAKTPDGQAKLQKEFDADLAAFDLEMKKLEERLQSTRSLKAEVEEMRAVLESKWEKCVEASVCK